MENWLERFYTQTDPVKRQQLLSENEGETEREEARLRKQLWEARYGKGKPRKDAYVGYLMNLKYIAESGGMDWGGRKKKLAMEAVHGLKLFQFEQKTEMEQELIYQAGGFWNITIHWINDGMEESPEEMAEVISSIMPSPFK